MPILRAIGIYDNSKLQLAHSHQVLGDLEETLLVLGNHVLGPENQVLVDLFDGLLEVPGQLDPLPQLAGHVGPLRRLDEQVDDALLLAHGGIL